MTTRKDTVIIGGGVIGLSIAWRTLQRGAAVTIIERSTIDGEGSSAGQTSSIAAAGMLAPQTEAEPGEEPLTNLLQQAKHHWPAFVQELEHLTGINIGYRTDGTLYVATTADEQASLQRLFDYQQRQHLPTSWLSGYQVRKLEPHLSRNVTAGILSEDDHQVDNRLLLKALLKAVKLCGGTVLENCLATTIEQAEHGLSIHLQDRPALYAKHVILATGAWQQLKLPDNPLLQKLSTWLRPIKGQMLSVKSERSLVEHVIWGSRIYLVPRTDGRLLIGATVEEQGFDTHLTAGGLRQLLNDAAAVLPDVDELNILETWAGLRPGSQDDAPIWGPVPGVPGLTLALGHYRNGILLAPLAGEILAGEVLSEQSTIPAMADINRI